MSIINEDVSIRPATPEDIEYVWENARPEDRRELEITGHTDDNVVGRFLDWSQVCMCGLVKGVPTAIFAYWIIETVRPDDSTYDSGPLYYGFMSTPAANRYWITISRIAKTFIAGRIEQHPFHRHMVAVWDQHTAAIKWLRWLGFYPTGAWNDFPDGRVLLLEKPRRTYGSLLGGA